MPNTIADNLLRLQTARTDIANAITTMGGTVTQGDGFEDFPTDIATITNQYTAQDEGKVVSNGALVAQTAYPSTITSNGTYDTTNYNSITINVSSIANSGVAYPPGSTTGFIIVSFIGRNVYVSTRLSDTSVNNTTATFSAPFQLSNFISNDMTFTIGGYKNSSATTYTMTVKLVPSDNQIVYKTSQSLAARSVFAGSSSISS